eukprot:3891050-Pyramimonas_sp.AAC.1
MTARSLRLGAGGRLQRLRYSAKLDGDTLDPGCKSEFLFDSETAHYLVEQWSMGLLSARKVQIIADHQRKDMEAVLNTLGASLDHVPSSLTALSKLGSGG